MTTLTRWIDGPRRIVARRLGREQRRQTPNRMIDDGRSTHMEQRADAFMAFPGMLPRPRGMMLYCLALGQTLRGDVVEIGSWQGRSTCFLAQACRDGGNGVVRAIDHFQGNAHRRDSYIVGRHDLGDLEVNFRRNIDAAGLARHVRLYAMTSAQAIEQHGEDFHRVRLLFIDGDHSEAGVTGDIDRFADRVMPGGLIVFDDYHSDGTGVVAAVKRRIFDGEGYESPVQFQGVLVVRKRGGE